MANNLPEQDVNDCIDARNKGAQSLVDAFSQTCILKNNILVQSLKYTARHAPHSQPASRHPRQSVTLHIRTCTPFISQQASHHLVPDSVPKPKVKPPHPLFPDCFLRPAPGIQAPAGALGVPYSHTTPGPHPKQPGTLPLGSTLRPAPGVGMPAGSLSMLLSRALGGSTGGFGTGLGCLQASSSIEHALNQQRQDACAGNGVGSGAGRETDVEEVAVDRPLVMVAAIVERDRSCLQEVIRITQARLLQIWPDDPGPSTSFHIPQEDDQARALEMILLLPDPQTDSLLYNCHPKAELCTRATLLDWHARTSAECEPGTEKQPSSFLASLRHAWAWRSPISKLSEQWRAEQVQLKFVKVCINQEGTELGKHLPIRITTPNRPASSKWSRVELSLSVGHHSARASHPLQTSEASAPVVVSYFPLSHNGTVNYLAQYTDCWRCPICPTDPQPPVVCQDLEGLQSHLSACHPIWKVEIQEDQESQWGLATQIMFTPREVKRREAGGCALGDEEVEEDGKDSANQKVFVHCSRWSRPNYSEGVQDHFSDQLDPHSHPSTSYQAVPPTKRPRVDSIHTKRTYFHSRTGLPMTAEELAHNSDSDDERDVAAEQDKLMRKLARQPGITRDSAEMMLLWNGFMARQPQGSVYDKVMLRLCMEFAREIAGSLHDRELRQAFMQFLKVMWRTLILSSDDLLKVMAVVIASGGIV